MSIKTTSKLFAKYAREENKRSEKFSLKYPNYLMWGNSLFQEKKSELFSLIM